MSTSGPINSLGFLLEVNKSFPEEWDVFLERFMDAYRDIARASNAKDIGLYDEEEILNGQQFFPNPTTTFTTTNRILRQAYRQVYQIPALVASPGPTNIAHGLTFPVPNTFHFTRIYGVIEDLTLPLYVPIPNDNVHMEVDGTNIVISGYPATFNGFTGVAVIEYLKN